MRLCRLMTLLLTCSLADPSALYPQITGARQSGPLPSATSPDPNMPRPIEAYDSVFIEEGNIDPPSGHIRYPGTISLQEDTYKRLLNEYYDYPGLTMWLESQGIHQVDEGLHDDLGISSIMMTVDPNTVRMRQRIAKGKFSINGVNLSPAEKTIEIGKRAVEYRATITVEAIRKAITSFPTGVHGLKGGSP